MEINRASMEELLRIPGIGNVSAMRIVRHRKLAAVKFEDLKQMGVVVKRAKYFITCCGRYYGDVEVEPDRIRRQITGEVDGVQLSLFGGPGGAGLLESGGMERGLSV